MDAGKQLTVIAVLLGVICLTVLYVFLFVSLWAYKQWVGGSLLAVVVLVVLVRVWGWLNEQRLRRVRYRPGEEIPLDGRGEPYYWPVDAQENPHHVLSQHASSLHEDYQRDW